MKIFILFWIIFAPILSHPQKSPTDAERDAIKRVVETYLFAEDSDERKQTVFSKTKILSINPDGKVAETPISKSSRKPKGARERSKQKVSMIDYTDGGAMVKIETDLSSETTKVPKHFHYLSLLKVNGEWKIVSVLMPPVGKWN